jgi:hypothetical protein
MPVPSDDSVSVRITGAIDYTNQGSGNGGFTVTKDAFGVRSVSGSLDIPGAAGGTAKVGVTATRAWILPLWTGKVTVNDPASNVSISPPLFGAVTSDTAPNSAKGTINWFVTGTFPQLIRTYTLNWSVTDAG